MASKRRHWVTKWAALDGDSTATHRSTDRPTVASQKCHLTVTLPHSVLELLPSDFFRRHNAIISRQNARQSDVVWNGFSPAVRVSSLASVASISLIFRGRRVFSSSCCCILLSDNVPPSRLIISAVCIDVLIIARELTARRHFLFAIRFTMTSCTTNPQPGNRR